MPKTSCHEAVINKLLLRGTNMAEITLDGVEQRDYQLETAAEMLDNPQENYVVNMPVGGGKTETALEMIATQYNQDEDYSTMIVLPSRRIEDQWFERMEEYGLDDEIEIVRNRTQKQMSATTDSGKMTGTHFRGSDNGGSKLRESRKRLEQWEEQRKNNSKEEQLREGDIILTTYQLLDSDLKNGRIDESILSEYKDIIVDETTHFAAIDGIPRPEAGKQFRTNQYFDRMYEEIQENDETRVVGLTAMYGSKMEAVQDQLDARLVRPSQERVDEFRPELERFQPNLAPDSDTINLLSGLEDQYRKLRGTIGRKMEDPSPEVNLYTLQNLVNETGEISQMAQKGLKLKSLQSRIQEGTFNSLRPYKDDIIEIADGFPVYRSEIKEAFENGIPAGENPELDQKKLENPREHDAPLFPTMKELGAQKLQNQVLERDEQALYFVRHVDTANDLPNVLPGSTGVITGQTDREDQRSLIQDFDTGEIDSLAMTYGSGGEGLDFSNAENVVLMGEPRTVQEHQNAVGRIRRGEGPKREHSMIYHNPQYEWRFERYQSILEEEAEQETNSPEPSTESIQQVLQALEPEA